VANGRRGTLLGVPIRTLAERVKAVRIAAGYGDDRQAADFARLIGIRPPSLHNLESGATLSLGKSLIGLLKIGASLKFLREGIGEPMEERNIERQLRNDTLTSSINELSDDEVGIVEDLVKGMIRRKKGSSPNDPFKQDPPGYQEGTQ
jgi:hypothetical protein